MHHPTVTSFFFLVLRASGMNRIRIQHTMLLSVVAVLASCPWAYVSYGWEFAPSDTLHRFPALPPTPHPVSVRCFRV